MTVLCIVLSLAARFSWQICSFDVEAAFLTGRAMARDVYFRPPLGGLSGLPCGCLLRALKGLFGIPEAPRLWYLEFVEKAKKAGAQQIP